MMKKYGLLAGILFFFTAVSAQFDTSFMKSRIRFCADSMALGFRTRNWDLFTRYTYPALVGTMGGRQAFINYVSQTFGRVPDSAWKQYQPGKVLQVVKTRDDLQAVIELYSQVETMGARIIDTSCLVAQSWDGGMFWTFFDSQGSVLAARTIKPDLSEDLLIPARNERMEPLKPAPGKKQQ